MVIIRIMKQLSIFVFQNKIVCHLQMLVLEVLAEHF